MNNGIRSKFICNFMPVMCEIFVISCYSKFHIIDSDHIRDFAHHISIIICNEIKDIIAINIDHHEPISSDILKSRCRITFPLHSIYSIYLTKIYHIIHIYIVGINPVFSNNCICYFIRI